MTGQEGARIFSTGGALDERLDEVAPRANADDDEGERHAVIPRQLGEEGREQQGGAGHDDESAEEALPRLAGRDAREEFPPTDGRSDEVGARVVEPDEDEEQQGVVAVEGAREGRVGRVEDDEVERGEGARGVGLGQEADGPSIDGVAAAMVEAADKAADQEGRVGGVDDGRGACAGVEEGGGEEVEAAGDAPESVSGAGCGGGVVRLQPDALGEAVELPQGRADDDGEEAQKQERVQRQRSDDGCDKGCTRDASESEILHTCGAVVEASAACCSMISSEREAQGRLPKIFSRSSE